MSVRRVRWYLMPSPSRNWCGAGRRGLRVGGAYRYVWRKEGAADMGMGGVFRKTDAPKLLVATERFDDSWYPGEALDTTVFREAGAVTNVTITVRYESKEARDTARRSGMEHGMAAGYNRLEELLEWSENLEQLGESK